MNTVVKCPNCGNPVEWSKQDTRPFCSERCRLIDLGHWADESHRIPGEKQDFPEEKQDNNET